MLVIKLFGALKNKLKQALSSVAEKIERKPKIEAKEKKEVFDELGIDKIEPVEDEFKTDDAIRDEQELFKPETDIKPVEMIQPKPMKVEENLKQEKDITIEPMKTERKLKVEPEPLIVAHKPVEVIKPETVEMLKPEPAKRGFLQKFTEVIIDENILDKIMPELERALLENDAAFNVVENISESVKKDLLGKSIKRGGVEKEIKESLRKSILNILKYKPINLIEEIEISEKPYTIIFVGFNGVGKTTTIAKIANMLKKHGIGSVLVAGDTFRAASIEQLEVHAKNLDMPVIKQKYGTDPAAVIFDGKNYAAARNMKAVLCDTAGRVHTNTNLMDELKKICRVNKPDMKILILDSLTGNDIYEQSKLFNDAVGVDAIILTKADVYEKGGAALSAAYTIQKPILFLCTGQEYDDIIKFNPDEIVDNIL